MTEVEHAAVSPLLRERVTLAIYATITLLGVIAASSWKGFASSEMELLVIIVSTSVTLAVAHFWASTMSHRMVDRAALSRRERKEQLLDSGVVLAVGAFATVATIVSWIVGHDLRDSVTYTLLTLVLLLFSVGLAGARRAGASWLRSIGWGAVDASIGVAILVAKIIFG